MCWLRGALSAPWIRGPISSRKCGPCFGPRRDAFKALSGLGGHRGHGRVRGAGHRGARAGLGLLAGYSFAGAGAAHCTQLAHDLAIADPPLAVPGSALLDQGPGAVGASCALRLSSTASLALLAAPVATAGSPSSRWRNLVTLQLGEAFLDGFSPIAPRAAECDGGDGPPRQLSA